MTVSLESLRHSARLAIIKAIHFARTARFGGFMPYDDAQAWKDVGEHFPHRTIYYVYLLKKGPTWSPDETPEIEALQEAHLANMRRLGEMGKLVLNGPLLDSFATSGEIRGIGVLKTSSLVEAQELLSTDPMVRVGRLIFELHTWMVEKNILP
jgi:uncharacterized protein